MAELLTPAQYPEYDAFVRGHAHGSFMQSPAWARVKRDWQQEIVVQRDAGGAICAGMSILIRRMGPGALLYAPRGPVCDYQDTDTLRQLLDGARVVAKKYHAHLLKMDPYILASDQALIDRWVAAGCSFQPDAAFYDTVQPRYNYMLPYIGGMTEAQLLAGFSSNTRNKMRHPGKHGVVCKNVGLAGLDDFYAIYAETGERQNFSVRPKEYLAGILQAFPDDARLYMCYTAEGIPLCGGIAINYAGKCAHVYGCSADHHRDLRPTYLLQWTLMNWALEKGCTIYDMQGVAIHEEDCPALYGVLGFKQSFKGEIVTTAGEFCVVYSRWKNAAFTFALRARKALRKALRQRHGAQKPDTDKPAGQKPATEKPTAEKPAAEKPAAQAPAVDGQTTKKPAAGSAAPAKEAP